MNLNLRFFSALAILAMATSAFATAPEDAKPVKNVIFMVPDGTSLPFYTMGRWLKGEPLSLDPYACGLVKTYSANSILTDSAASATAYSTGSKTKNRSLGIAQDGKTILKNVAELAHEGGRSVGIVVTCQIVDATPAAFSAHVSDRGSEKDIFTQQIRNGYEVLLGGGTSYLSKEDEDFLKTQGYDVLKDKTAFDASKNGKFVGLFGETMMSYEIDRDPAKEPSLAEMTSKAIDTLSKNPKGFFLLVEGSKIDKASHQNDPVGALGEFAAFDKAFKVALDFAKANGDTAIIVCADHGNGGVSLCAENLEILKNVSHAKCTPAKLQEILKADPSPEAVKAKTAEFYGIKDLTKEELDALVKVIPGTSKDFVKVAAMLMSKRAKIRWTTGGHTGEDTILFCFAPGPRPEGVIENTDVNRWMRSWLSIKN